MHCEFTVGEWKAVPSRNAFLRGDEEVKVEPRVMDLLVHLAGHANQIVAKEELIEQLWNGRCVTDDSLTVTICALRKALGDDARRPRYIETVSRRGYRLIATVIAAPIPAAAPAAVSVAPVPAAAPTAGSGAPMPVPAPPAWASLAASTVLALAAIAAIWTMGTARPRGHVASAEAHEAYLKGRYFLDQRSTSGWRQALEQFERASTLDPLDPASHAGLADAYSAMSDFGVATAAEMRPRAMTEAARALDLEPRSAEGFAALGRAQFLFDWDFAAADRSLAKAIAIDAAYMPAYQSLAWLRSAQARHAEAAAAGERALQLDPVNTARYVELAWVLELGGRHGEALRQVDRGLQLNPRSFETLLMKGWVLDASGRSDAAFEAYRQGLRFAGVPEQSLTRMQVAYAAEGLSSYYRGLLNRRGDTPMSDTWRAQVYARVGELDHALESLEKAYQKREGALAWVNVEPSFRPLRPDARFQQIAMRVGR